MLLSALLIIPLNNKLLSLKLDRDSEASMILTKESTFSFNVRWSSSLTCVRLPFVLTSVSSFLLINSSLLCILNIGVFNLVCVVVRYKVHSCTLVCFFWCFIHFLMYICCFTYHMKRNTRWNLHFTVVGGRKKKTKKKLILATKF